MRYGSADLLSVAPLTCAFLAINIVLYGVSSVRSGNPGNMDYNVLMALGGSMRERLWEGEWLRLFAPIFLHGGFLHILLNTSYLFNAGPEAEVHFGTSNFGTLYLLSGVGGCCASQLFGGHMSIGASGALFGIMGAVLAVKVHQAPVLRHAWRNREVRQVAFMLLLYSLIGLTGMMRVDNWGHFGGLLVGTLLAFSFELWRRRSRWGFPVTLVVVLLIGVLVVAARWTVFSPYYHLHQGAVAAEEERPQEEIDAHFDQAREWGHQWGNEPLIELMIRTHQAGQWSAAEARDYGYRWIADVHRAPNAPRPRTRPRIRPGPQN